MSETMRGAIFSKAEALNDTPAQLKVRRDWPEGTSWTWWTLPEELIDQIIADHAQARTVAELREALERIESKGCWVLDIDPTAEACRDTHDPIEEWCAACVAYAALQQSGGQ